jgi:Spx/MgsR family transcriptional regulator
MKAYGLKKCSTCQKAMAFLDEKKAVYKFIDHSETPPSADQVAKWSKALGGWEKLINRAGYTWRGLPKSEIEGLTEEAAVRLAARYPQLIRRPLIEHDDGTVTVGFAAKVQDRF